MSDERTLTAFSGHELLAAGTEGEVIAAIRAALAAGETRTILVFDDTNGRQIDLDLRAPDPGQVPFGDEASPSARKVGRPRLGVQAREVTLLPRHWEWLSEQPGGASVTLRKLVDVARKAGSGLGAVRRAREAADRFMSALLGNEPGYEEAARALYAADRDRFLAQTRAWPAAPRAYLLRLAADVFPAPNPGGVS
jgi:uncharacterized protein